MEHNFAMMNPIPQNQRVLELALQKGFLRSSDLEQINVPRVLLTRMSANGQLEKVSRGVYRLPNNPISEHETLLTIATMVPQAVFCLLSALQYYELTTQLPGEIWIAMPRGSHAPKIAYPPVKMIQFSGEAYSQGIETVERDQVTFRIYSVAKTIVDCFKHRNKIGIDVAIEALKEARFKRQIDMNELWRFAKICRVTNLMRPYLEATE
jgi:predicted transcriptional regulator of viral defense system